MNFTFINKDYPDFEAKGKKIWIAKCATERKNQRSENGNVFLKKLIQTVQM